MKQSTNYNFSLPEYDDYEDVEPLSENFSTIDAELARQRDEDVRLEADKATRVELRGHIDAKTLDHPDGSVTDAKLGSRTVLTSSGTLQTLLTAIGNAVKGITGGATWNAAPDITLKAGKARHDATDAAHAVFVARRDNPHAVTKAQTGLGNADNTSDIAKPVSTAQAAAIKVVQNDVSAHKAATGNVHGAVPGDFGAYTKAETDARVKTANDALTTHGADAVKHLNTAERNKWNDKYTKAEVDNKFSGLETATDWKESVANFAAIATTYPSPQDGWTVNTRDTDYTYRYSGAAWVVISANAIPKATGAVDGLMPKENVTALAGAVAAQHTHGNKSVLDGLTAALVANWNAAFAHIADAVKHITAAERTLWNSVSAKLALAGGTLTGFLTLHANPTANLHAATKQYVDNIASGKGNGDMLKSVYDTNNDGVVDNAKTVDGNPAYRLPAVDAKGNTYPRGLYDLQVTYDEGVFGSPAKLEVVGYDTPSRMAPIAPKPVVSVYHSECSENAQTVNRCTVSSNVPANAKFTDTVYTHPATHPASMIVDYAGKRFVTDAEKANWNGKAAGSHTHTKANITDFPASLPANGGNAATVNGLTVQTAVPAGAKFTDTVYTHPGTHPSTMISQDATHRFATDAEKTKWNGALPMSVGGWVKASLHAYAFQATNGQIVLHDYGGTPNTRFTAMIQTNNGNLDYAVQSGGHRFINNSAQPANCYANAFVPSSALRYKENIADMTEERAKQLLTMRPVTFDFKAGNQNQMGMIAEEMQEIEPGLVPLVNGEVEGINYTGLIAPLIKLCQMQETRIADLEARLDAPDASAQSKTEVG